LKRLLADGLTAGQIAKALGGGISRNAVLGKVYRLNLSFSRQSFRPARTEKTKAAPRERKRATPKPKPTVSSAPMPVQPFEDFSKDAVKGIPAAVLALRPRQCRYPFGEVGAKDFHFCQRDSVSGSVEETPYCAVHSAGTRGKAMNRVEAAEIPPSHSAATRALKGRRF
jgi:GcrA cell cycle regulator